MTTAAFGSIILGVPTLEELGPEELRAMAGFPEVAFDWGFEGFSSAFAVAERSGAFGSIKRGAAPLGTGCTEEIRVSFGFDAADCGLGFEGSSSALADIDRVLGSINLGPDLTVVGLADSDRDAAGFDVSGLAVGSLGVRADFGSALAVKFVKTTGF